MRPRLIDEWGYGGDPEDGTGFITHRRVPAHWWLLGRWLERGHPHWDWWYRAWGRLLPYWGDPFCAAYTVVWTRIYQARAGEESHIDVGWDALPESVKSDILARASEDE